MRTSERYLQGFSLQIAETLKKQVEERTGKETTGE